MEQILTKELKIILKLTVSHAYICLINPAVIILLADLNYTVRIIQLYIIQHSHYSSSCLCDSNCRYFQFLIISDDKL